MYFDSFLKNSTRNYNLGELCDLLTKANIGVYHYDNEVWRLRKKKKNDLVKINQWDELSRRWNEKRSLIKNQIDKLLKRMVSEKKQESALRSISKKKLYSYKVLPLSLLIDMLTIENIKIYDHSKKRNERARKKSQAKAKELIKSINTVIVDIITSRHYSYEEETRTF